MGCKRTDCVSKPLSGLFEKLGSLVGSFPLYFIVIPLILTAVFGGGFTFLKEREDNDLERQYTPRKGPSKVTRDFVNENFPYNASMFSTERMSNKGHFASIIAVANGDLNVLASPFFQDITRLNSKILNITVDNGSVGFTDVCEKAFGRCVSNVILEIVGSGLTNLTFPVYVHGSKSVFLGPVLGGVTTGADGSVISAQAVKLSYYLDDTESKAETSKLWLKGFKELMSEEIPIENVEMSYYTSKSKQEEIDSHTTDGFPLFLITYVCAISLAVVSCLRLDNVRNKVWVAVLGVLCAGLAVISSFGFMLYIGVPFVITVANSPFLILGIGLNNMFVMVSDWQHTHVADSVPQRMAHTYKEAVMSITITALTDVLKFSIGVSSDFPAVQWFCVYTTTSILFCYVYTITFFGACLALNGRREADNRHWLTCMKIPSDAAESRSWFGNICCVGGGYDEKTGAEKKHPASNFFKDYYGPFLMKPWVKGGVVVLFVGYLAASIFGCFHIEQGIELYDLAADDSHVTGFNKKDREYFSDYGLSVMVIVSEQFAYWDKTERRQLQVCFDNFKELSFIDGHIYTSWLDSYLTYGEENRLNLDDKSVFLQNLNPFFDSFPFFRQDVNLTGDAIYASRVFIQTTDIANSSMEIKMLAGFKSAVENCHASSLLVYNLKFIFYDQYDVVVSSTVKNVAVITAVMLVVSLLLIPHPVCSLWVTLAIGSVTAGVAGFMVLWDISLDSISMIIFSVCIGFTVDFSAHISYAFVSSDKPSPDEKAVEALSNLGYPILQGTFSTVLGVLVLATSEFHTFRTFFRIFLLVMMIGMLHGLVFIPVILALCTCRSDKEESKDKSLKISKL